MNLKTDFENIIYFSDCLFRVKSRTLQRNGITQQLRKKDADVLELLCRKYPEPVSHEDFLETVWQGGYVTGQSIAQVIHSLRQILSDEGKTIIATIPKLGYKINMEPAIRNEIPTEYTTLKPCEIAPDTGPLKSVALSLKSVLWNLFL